jgi:hypothetical protein
MKITDYFVTYCSCASLSFIMLSLLFPEELNSNIIGSLVGALVAVAVSKYLNRKKK